VVNPFDPSRTRPPRVVTVLGTKIQVRTFRHLILDGHDLLGRFQSDKMQISLLKREDWRSTLFHEMIHAALFLSGAGEGLTYTKEESIVQCLEYALFQFVK
jgi:hypothetical protein